MKKVKLIALLAAAIAALGVYFFLKELQKPRATPQTQVVVALVDIPENTVITEEMVALQPVAKDAARPSALLDPKSAVGRIASGDIYAGEQLITERLASSAAEGDSAVRLAYMLEDGARAITVAVDEVTGLENMIKPGNRVDLVTSYAAASAEDRDGVQTLTGIFAQNLKVLAVGTAFGKDGETAYTTITLQATPEEALLISHATYVGNIRVLLRAAQDDSTVNIGEFGTEAMREGVLKP